MYTFGLSIKETRIVYMVTMLAVLVGLVSCGSQSRPKESDTSLKKHELFAQSMENGKKTQHTTEHVLLEGVIKPLAQKTRLLLDDSCTETHDSRIQYLDSTIMALSVRFFMIGDANEQVSMLSNFIFDELQIRFSEKKETMSTLFPHLVVHQKEGSCIGLSLLFLLIGEKIGIPLYGVVVPGHLFVRYDDGTTRINIETMKKGKNMPDEWYREKYAISDNSMYDFQNLSVREVCALLKYNVGNICLSKEKHADAVGLYRDVVDVFPNYCEAWGNLGLAQNVLGDYATALESLERAEGLCPELKNIHHNKGVVLLKSGDYSSAIEEYKKALGRDPYDPDILYGLGAACYHLGNYDKARFHLGNALSIRSDFPDAREILTRLDTKSKTASQ